MPAFSLSESSFEQARRWRPRCPPTALTEQSGRFADPQPLIYVLKQCGDDLSRENIMHQATNLHDVAMPWMLPGFAFNASPTDYQPIKQLREMRFNGKTWELLNEEN
jgi:hypothetical protein